MMMRLRKHRGYRLMRNRHGDNDDDELDGCEDGDIYSLIGSTIVAKREPRSASITEATAVTTPSYLSNFRLSTTSSSSSSRHPPNPVPADNSSSNSSTSEQEDAFPLLGVPRSLVVESAASRVLRERVSRDVVECNRLLLSNDYDACVNKCRASLQLIDSRWGRYTQATVDVYHTIGQAFYQRQSYDEALVAFRTANRIDEYLAIDQELLLRSTKDTTYRGRGRHPPKSHSRLQRELAALNVSEQDHDDLSTTSTITNMFSVAAAPSATAVSKSPDLNPRYTLRDDLTKAILLLRSSSASSPTTSDRIDRHVYSHRRHLQQSVLLEHEGDQLRSRGQYTAAVQKYCKAISMEEAAFGGTIGLDLAYLWRKLACIVNLRNINHPDDFHLADLIRPDSSSSSPSESDSDSLSSGNCTWLEAVKHRMPARVRQSIRVGDSDYIRSHYKEAIAEYRKATIIGRYYYCEQFHRHHGVRSQSLVSSSLLSISDSSPKRLPWYMVGLLLISLGVNVAVAVAVFHHSNLLSRTVASTSVEVRDALLVGLATVLIYILATRGK